MGITSITWLAKNLGVFKSLTGSTEVCSMLPSNMNVIKLVERREGRYVLVAAQATAHGDDDMVYKVDIHTNAPTMDAPSGPSAPSSSTSLPRDMELTIYKIQHTQRNHTAMLY